MRTQVASSFIRETWLTGIASSPVMCCFNGRVLETTQGFKNKPPKLPHQPSVKWCITVINENKAAHKRLMPFLLHPHFLPPTPISICTLGSYQTVINQICGSSLHSNKWSGDQVGAETCAMDFHTGRETGFSFLIGLAMEKSLKICLLGFQLHI